MRLHKKEMTKQPQDLREMTEAIGSQSLADAGRCSPSAAQTESVPPKLDSTVTCAHNNATLSEIMPGLHLRCPDCHKEISLGLKGVPRESIDDLLHRVVDHIRSFDRVDNGDIVAAPTGVTVHGVLKDTKTGLPIVMASFQMAVVLKKGFPESHKKIDDFAVLESPVEIDFTRPVCPPSDSPPSDSPPSDS